MTCPACGRELPAAFPGASVSCACGERVSIAAAPARASSTPPSAPYRTSGVAYGPERETTCPFCGNHCPPLVRVCPHCDVKLETVRCRRCFTLQQPGAFACGRCGQAMELEPMLDATDAPCPRCAHPLDATDEAEFRLHECARCGGIFVPKDALAEILCRAEIGGAVPESAHLAARANHLEEVRYLPCPLCHGSMNRVNFGRVSGVIVDVCKIHGTWFDAGELTRVVAFAGAGGLEKTREREKNEREAARKESHEIHTAFVAIEAREEMQSRLSLWRDLLQAILFW